MKSLLAIDDSKYSVAATQTVIRQFQPRNTEVRVLHVVEPVRYAAVYVPKWEDQVANAQELAEQAAQGSE